MAKISSGTYPIPCYYSINGVRVKKPYWFSYGIYPKWPVFMSIIANPVSKKDQLYAKIQEAIRKDIERAFGVLQGNWHIFLHASCFMTVDTVHMIVKFLVIMDNMCVEKRLDEDGDLDSDLLGSVASTMGKVKAPMWCGLIRLSTASPVSVPGSLAALLEVKKLMEYQAEHMIKTGSSSRTYGQRTAMCRNSKQTQHVLNRRQHFPVVFTYFFSSFYATSLRTSRVLFSPAPLDIYFSNFASTSPCFKRKYFFSIS